MVRDAYFSTEKLLKENRAKLDKLAKELLKKETLYYQDIKDLIGPPPFGEKSTVETVDLQLPTPAEGETQPPPEA